MKFYAAYSNLCTRVRMLEHQFLYTLENTRYQWEFSEIHLDGELMMPVEAIAMAHRLTFITTPMALQSFLSRNGIPIDILEQGLENAVIFNAMANVSFGMNPNCLSTHQCPQPLIDFVKEHQAMLREKRNAFANTFFTATKEEVFDVLSILPQGPKTVALAAIESGGLLDINDPDFNQMLHERIARGAIEPMVVGDSFLAFFMETVNETMTLLESRPLIDGVAELQAGIRDHIIVCFEKIMAIVYEKISSWTCPRDITTKSLQELSELSDAWESYYNEQMTLLRPFIGLLSKKHLHAFPEFNAIFNALHQISRMQHEFKGAMTNRAEQLMPEGILSMQMKHACHQHFDRMIEDLNAVELSKFTSFHTQLKDAIRNLMDVNDSHTEDIHTFCLFLGFPRDAEFTFESLKDYLASLRDATGETMTFDMPHNDYHAFVLKAIEQIERNNPNGPNGHLEPPKALVEEAALVKLVAHSRQD